MIGNWKGGTGCGSVEAGVGVERWGRGGDKGKVD